MNDDNTTKSIANMLDGNVTTESILWALNKYVIVSMTDIDGNITYANDKFAEFSQYSREELIGQNHRILKSGFHPQSLFDDMWQNYLTKGKVWAGELKNKTKDGTLHWVYAIIAPLLDADGLSVGYFSTRFSIEERKTAEEKFKITSNILKQASMPWCMMDLTGHIVDSNQALTDMFGYTHDEMQQITYANMFVPKKGSDEQKHEFERILAKKEVTKGEAIGIKKGGQKFDVAYSVNVYFGYDKSTYLCAFLTDITERKAHDAETEQLNQLMVSRELKMVELKQQLAKLTKPDVAEELDSE